MVVLVFSSLSMGRETTVENFSTPHESFHLRDCQAKFGPVQCGSSLATTAVPTVQHWSSSGTVLKDLTPAPALTYDIAGQYRFGLGLVSLPAPGALG